VPRFFPIALRQGVVAILARRPADECAETRAERAEAREADQKADLGDGKVRGSQERLRALDPASGEIGTWRLTIGRRERASEVKSGVAGFAGHRVEVERLRVVAIDEVASSSQRRQEVQRVLGHRRHLNVEAGQRIDPHLGRGLARNPSLATRSHECERRG